MIWKPNVTVAAVIEQNGRYLLVEEEIEGRRVFNQPAGHLEEGEPLAAAVTREVLEETAHHFVPEAVVAVQLWCHPQRRLSFLRFAFSGRVTGHEPRRPLDRGIVAARWLAPVEIGKRRRQLRSPLVLESIAAYERGQRFPLNLIQSFL